MHWCVSGTSYLPSRWDEGRQRGLEGAALSKTTGLPQTASEDGHHSEQVD